MYSIYKGYNFPISIESNVAIDLTESRLFNPATKFSQTMTLIAQYPQTPTASTTKYEYQVVITASDTAEMPSGVYSLELRTSNGYMAEFIKDFAKVVDTAYVYIEESSES